MGRTACTEPQCLYKGDLYLYLYKIDLKLWTLCDTNNVYVLKITQNMKIKTYEYRIIILAVILYGCETWSLHTG